MKLTLIFVLIVFTSSVTLGQLTDAQKRTVDSLKVEIKKPGNGKVKLKALLQLENLIYPYDNELDFNLNQQIESLCQTNLKKRLNPQTKIIFKRALSSSLNNIGIYYKRMGDISKAIKYYTASMKIDDELGDKLGFANSLNNIGIIYQQQKQFKKSLEYHLRALTQYELLKNDSKIGASLNNIGNVYFDQRKLDTAMSFYMRYLEISTKLGDKSGLANAYSNIGIVHSELKNYNEALEVNFKSLRIREELEDPFGISNSLSNIGYIYYLMNDLSNAIKYDEKALKTGKESGSAMHILYATEHLVNNYKKAGNSKKALEMFEQAALLRDSINSENSRNELARQEFKYVYEKKAAADSIRVVEEKKVINAKLKQEQTQRYTLYGGLCLTIIFGAFMFNRFKVTQKQKKIIEDQKRLVELQKAIVDEKQKEVMDSIHYAKRIQIALLPTNRYIEKNLNQLKKKA